MMVVARRDLLILLLCAASFLPLMGGSSVQPTVSTRGPAQKGAAPRSLPRLRGGGACICIPHRWREMDELMLNEYLGKAATLGNIERVKFRSLTPMKNLGAGCLVSARRALLIWIITSRVMAVWTISAFLRRASALLQSHNIFV